jgi:AcrR family transcriptional regulator
MTEVGLRARKRKAARDAIVAQAVRLFSERGVDGVTIDEIAAAADVGKGTVYTHFAAKEDILAAFLLELDRAALDGLADIARRAPTVVAALIEASWSLLDNKAAHHGFVRAFLGRLFAGGRFAEDLTEFQAAMDQAMTDFFDILSARADLPDRPVAAATSELVLTFKTLQLGLSALWAIEGPPFAGARRLSEIEMNLFARGLECPTPSIWPSSSAS